MKKIVLSALAVAAAAGVAHAQTLEWRIVERFSDTEIGPGDAAPTGAPNTAGNAADRTLWFVVQARVTGLQPGAAINGLGGMAGEIQITQGAGGGQFKVAGTGGTPGGSPTNASPVNFFPAGSPNPGLGTTGQAFYAPFRLLAGLGAGGNGSIVAGDHTALRNVAGATGGEALAELTAGNLDNSFWGVDTFVNVYAFQYDVTDLTARTLTFSTAFAGSTYFTSVDESGVPNSIVFGQESNGSYSVTITPAPGAAALLGLGGLVAARRRRA